MIDWSSNEYEKKNDSSTTMIHVMALDEVVSANSLFTAAVFVSISLTSTAQLSNNSLSSCNAGMDMVRNAIVFQVISFSCFLFSSVIAQGMKLGINLINSNDPDEAFEAEVNTKLLSVGLVCAGIGSIVGCIFFILSLVFMVQIQLGLLSCGGDESIRAVTALVVLVGSALALYVWTVYYSFTH